MFKIIAALLLSLPVMANPPVTWGGSTKAQLFPTITRSILGNNVALISTKPMFGDCSNGDVTISTNQSLTQDMYYNNLTINSGATLNTSGFRVFVCGNLDFSAAGFIFNPANAGTAGAAAGGGGAQGTGGPIGSMNRGTAGTAGSSGTVNSPAGATTVAASTTLTGTNGGAGGTGGIGNGTGGAGGGTGVATFFPVQDFSTFILPQTAANVVIATSIGGSGGGGGGGNGANSGGGGGGGGAGGNPVWVTAYKIITSASTSLGAIQSGGGPGGAGGSPTATCSAPGCGGGGGGGGGVGGYVVVRYMTKTGPSVFLTYTGGGTGGTGGTGKNGTNGGNGIAGASGLIYHVDLGSGLTTKITAGLGAL